MEFNLTSGNIIFSVDNEFLGEYVLSNHSDTIEVSLGIFSNDNISSTNSVYMDDIVVILGK